MMCVFFLNKALYVIKFYSLTSRVQIEEQILICSACNTIMHPYAFLKHALSQFISYVQNLSALGTESFELFFNKIILLMARIVTTFFFSYFLFYVNLDFCRENIL